MTPPEAPPTELLPTYIHRLPEMDFVVESSDPTREGWPTPGQQVTWQAHLRKIGGEDGDVPYAWTLDGDTVATGTVMVPADSAVTVDYPWTWTFDRHVLGFVVDPGSTIHEENEYNNTLEVYTDALSLGIWVEQRFYDYYRDHISEVSGTLSSFEDWVQFHVTRFNSLMAGARYDETPDGVLDRIRLDKIVVVPDGTLSTDRRPAPDDHTVDLEWGYRAEFVDYLDNGTPGSPGGYSPAFAFNGATLHEWGHVRYLVDVYLWNVDDGQWGYDIEIQEGGKPILGTPYLPGLGIGFEGSDTFRAVYRTPEHGLMNQTYSYLDRYSAIALNLIAHQRPLYDNTICPRNCGIYMQDMPANNVLELTDEAGTPLGGASVEIYRSAFNMPDLAHPTLKDNYFDDVADFQDVADGEGNIAVGHNPFGVGDPNGTGYWAENPRRHIILRVEEDGRVGYTILESRVFNLEYWHGHTDVGHYPVTVKLLDPPGG